MLSEWVYDRARRMELMELMELGFVQTRTPRDMLVLKLHGAYGARQGRGAF